MIAKYFAMYEHILTMVEVATVTSILFYDPGNGNHTEWTTAGNQGEGERLIEKIESLGHRVIEISVRDVHDVPPCSELWGSLLLRQYREQVFGPESAIGSTLLEIA